jgi:hypothetical protein
MIFGADLSSYDGSDGTVVDPYQFVILNVQDPTIAAKINRAKAKGIPWGLYTWVYPGAGANSITLAKRIIDTYGKPPKGVWLDYEQAGVTPGDLTDALVTGEQAGMELGVYTYLAILPSVATSLRGHPLWLAFYPHPNDGSYPGGSEQNARDHGAKLWQYTSSNGTRDLNVILDEAWWHTWGDDTEEPTPNKKGQDVIYKEENGQYWEMGVGDYVLLPAKVGAGAELNGAAVVPISTAERIVMGKAAKDQLAAALKLPTGGSGSGLDADDVRKIVREELNKTKLGN